MLIGIYGGSYNPIHRGHTELAKALVAQGLVDELWLMVSPLNPLKEANKSEYAAYDDRLHMARLATEGIPGVKVSDFERTLPLPSYTINTLKALEEAYPQHRFALVIGADNWQRFTHWYKAGEIRQNYKILIYKRRGYDIDAETVDTPLYDISSTELRQALRSHQDTSEWLDEKARKYIEEKGLYQ